MLSSKIGISPQAHYLDNTIFILAEITALGIILGAFFLNKKYNQSDLIFGLSMAATFIVIFLTATISCIVLLNTEKDVNNPKSVPMQELSEKQNSDDISLSLLTKIDNFNFNMGFSSLEALLLLPLTLLADTTIKYISKKIKHAEYKPA